RLTAIFLVGGSSRIPLAATLLHRGFGLAPTAIEQPELVVAEGALYLAPLTGRASVAGGAVSPVSGVPVSAAPTSPVSGVPTSSDPVSPAYTTPSADPGLPPLVPTGMFPVVPAPTSAPPTPPPPVQPPQ